MADTRQLRDRIEALQAELARVRQHMDRLRQQHAREVEGLASQLATAQRALSEMTARAVAAEARGSVSTALERAPSPGEDREPNALVALASAPADPEAAARLIAASSTVPLIDARMRLRAAPPIPIARLALGAAETLTSALRLQGLEAVSLAIPPRASWPQRAITSFEFEESALVLESDGRWSQLPYSELKLLTLVRRSSARLEIRQEIDRSDPRRPKLVEDRSHPVKEEHLLWAFSTSMERLGFGAQTDFRGMGAQLSLTIPDNLRALGLELSHRAPSAVFDDRLARGAPMPSLLVAEGAPDEVLAHLLHQSLRSR